MPSLQVAANYYEKLPAYMQDIFRLTHRAAKEDEEDVAKQAIEFWCTVCEEELDIQQVSAPRALLLALFCICVGLGLLAVPLPCASVACLLCCLPHDVLLLSPVRDCCPPLVGLPWAAAGHPVRQT